MDYEYRFKALEARIAALEAVSSAKRDSGGHARVADDKLLHGPYGDPEVGIDPRAWEGPSMKGRRFSACPPEWLDLAADMFDVFGSRAEQTNKVDKNNKPVAWRDFQKAALCRRWAIELRKQGAGTTTQQAAPTKPASDPWASDDDQDSLPF